MKYVLYKLIPPRPSFPADMTPAEAELMREHSEYWRHLMSKGLIAVFGAVSDPKGPYGIAVLQLNDDADVNDLGGERPDNQGECGLHV